jgi:hypothetical protein
MVSTTSTRAQAARLSTPPKNRSMPFSGVTSVTFRMVRPATTPSHCPMVRQRMSTPTAVIRLHWVPTEATARGTSQAAAQTPRPRPRKVPRVVKKPLRIPARK